MADNVLCHIGAEETLEAFTQNLVGAKPGEQRRFEVEYPADYPDKKLAGKKYTYTAEVVAVKEKKLPELNDEFAKDVSDVANPRRAPRKSSPGAGSRDATSGTPPPCAMPCSQKLSPRTISRCPKRWSKTRWMCAWSAPCGLWPPRESIPRAVNVDWVAMRRRQQRSRHRGRQGRAAARSHRDGGKHRSHRRGDRTARSPGSPSVVANPRAAVRASLTKQGALDRMKSKLRSEKTLEWLQQNPGYKLEEPERS